MHLKELPLVRRRPMLQKLLILGSFLACASCRRNASLLYFSGFRSP